MPNTRFEFFKISKAIKRSGCAYTFYRKSKNKFGEPTTEKSSVCTIKGLYHEENSFVSIVMDDTTVYRTKKQPKILCLYEDTEVTRLTLGDTININGKTFKVSAITNIQEWNIVADISLEEVVENVSSN